MKRIIISIAAICMMSSKILAQQDVMVSQYMFNGLLLNPAYAGSQKYITSTLMYRNQWVGLKGAPSTTVLAVDGPIKTKNMGLGLILVNDQIGATTQTDVYANYAYQINIKNGKLALGIKAGVSRYLFDSGKLTYWDASDKVYDGGTKQAQWLPKFGVGAYYFTRNWYAGISVPTVWAYDRNYNAGININKSTMINRHYMLTGGYVFTINKDVKLKPSILLKYLPGAPLQVDFNTNLLYKDHYWIGASYRTGDAVSILLQYQTNYQFRLGYSYDFTVSNVRKYSNGSHEFMIGYDFGKEVAKFKNPRYF
jgi:type IX secretion system PorP/SprF family membrane protein